MLHPLMPAAEACFEVQKRGREEPPWNCSPLFVPYCCNIPESGDISAVTHGVSLRRPSVCCLTTTAYYAGCAQRIQAVQVKA